MCRSSYRLVDVMDVHSVFGWHFDFSCKKPLSTPFPHKFTITINFLLALFSIESLPSAFEQKPFVSMLCIFWAPHTILLPLAFLNRTETFLFTSFILYSSSKLYYRISCSACALFVGIDDGGCGAMVSPYIFWFRVYIIMYAHAFCTIKITFYT